MRNLIADLMHLCGRLNPLSPLRRDIEALKRECKLVVPVPPDVILTRFDGFILSLPAWDHGTVASYVFEGNVELGFRLLFRRLVREGMTVVDVGAHIGIYTLLASSLVGGNGRVFSFEPTPAIHSLLCDNVNRTAYRHLVSIHQNAVSDRHGARVSFAVATDSTRNSSLYFDAGAGGQKIIEVETVALDRAIPAEQRVDVVKIDAEGAEPAVIRGMKRILESNPGIVLFMEYAPEHIRRAGESAEAMLRQLSELGFGFHVIRDFEGACDEIRIEDLLKMPCANLLVSRQPPKDIQS